MASSRLVPAYLKIGGEEIPCGRAEVLIHSDGREFLTGKVYIDENPEVASIMASGNARIFIDLGGEI